MRLRFQERPAAQQRGRGFMLTLGLVGLVGVVLLAAIGFNAPNSIPGRGYYNLEAEFANADNIAKHGQVRIGGKIVGQVLHPRVEDGKGIIDLQIDPKYRPLRSDTTVEVRPRSAVGVRYVDIHAGQSGAPLKEGDRIPAAQTSATTTLDEVLGTFDKETRANGQKFFQGFGGGFAGRGEDLSDTLGEAPEMLAGTDAVLSAITGRGDAAGELIRGGATAAEAADPVRDQIRTGFAPEAKALEPFAQEGVRNTLTQAPSTLQTASSRLPVINGFVSELEGFSRAVRPALHAAPGAFTQTSALLREAGPGLRDADTTLERAGAAVSPVLSLLSTVKPVLPRIEDTLTNATPLVVKLGQHGCDIYNFGARWGDMMQFGNSAGGVLRLNLIAGTPEHVIGLSPSLTKLAVNTNAYPAPCVAGHEEVKPFSLGGN